MLEKHDIMKTFKVVSKLSGYFHFISYFLDGLKPSRYFLMIKNCPYIPRGFQILPDVFKTVWVFLDIYQDGVALAGLKDE